MSRDGLALLMGVALLGTALSPGYAQLPGGPDPVSTPALRHSPLFGLGPQTIYKGGWGVEIGGAWSRAGTGAHEQRGVYVNLHYGITEDLNVSLALPLLQNRQEMMLSPGVGQVVRDATGIGDVVLQGKYRLWKDLFPGGNHQATVIAGVKLPTGRAAADPPLGSGSVDFLAGAAVSRETHRYYAWASLLGRVNTEATGYRRGNELRFDLAVGVRPYVPQWTSPDLMLLVELVGVTAAPSVGAAGEDPNSGGRVLAVAPGFWLTYRNWALKGGVKLPFHQRLSGTQPQLDFEIIAAVEYHFGG